MADNEELKLEERPASGKNPLLTVLLLLNTILMGGVAYFQYQAHLKLSSSQSIQDVVRAHQSVPNAEDFEDLDGEAIAAPTGDLMVPLGDQITANLAQGDGPRRFARVNLVLHFEQGYSGEEVTARMPQIRDTIISTLNTKRPEDILATEGKAYLKEEMRTSINTFLRRAHLKDIYYTEFTVQ
jgi:flagellar protein FliL